VQNFIIHQKKIIMKTKLLSIVYWITLTCYAINTNAQANRQLSNLISPTAVNINLLPGGTTGTKDLGSNTKRWKNGYFNGSVYCYGAGNAVGVYGVGSSFGLAGLGSDIGVYGKGPTGVFGDGTMYGVYGEGGTYGVFGLGNSYGLYARGVYGVYASGTSDISVERFIRAAATLLPIKS